MNHVLLPNTTAVWLIEHTRLTFAQIGQFCSLHPLEVQAIADGKVTAQIGLDPVTSGQLTRAEIERCENDPTAELQLKESAKILRRTKGPRYTPLIKRSHKPEGILWCLKAHPELSIGQIEKLVGTTRSTIESIRDRKHRDISHLEAKNPAEIGLCTFEDLEAAISKAQKKQAALAAAQAEASVADETSGAPPTPEEAPPVTDDQTDPT